MPDRPCRDTVGAMTPRLRRAVLTLHIIASVALLGDSAGFLAVALRAATTDDPALADASYELLAMFSVVFGIPLSMLSLASGIALGLGTKWGVFKHAWTTIKLGFIVSVAVVGALVIGPSTEAMRTGSGGREWTIVLAAAYDVLVLSLAVGLSVYKPRRRQRARRRMALSATRG
jgi:uncharacterized membrane protein